MLDWLIFRTEESDDVLENDDDLNNNTSAADYINGNLLLSECEDYLQVSNQVDLTRQELFSMRNIFLGPFSLYYSLLRTCPLDLNDNQDQAGQLHKSIFDCSGDCFSQECENHHQSIVLPKF